MLLPLRQREDQRQREVRKPMELTLERNRTRHLEPAARATSTISREENRKRFWTGSMVMRWKAAETGELS